MQFDRDVGLPNSSMNYEGGVGKQSPLAEHISVTFHNLLSVILCYEICCAGNMWLQKVKQFY